MRSQLEEHYGKLWVLGMGLVFSREIYLWLFGTEIAKDGVHATALLVGIHRLIVEHVRITTKRQI